MMDQLSLFSAEPPECVYEAAKAPLTDAVVSLPIETQKEAVAIRTDDLETVVDVAEECEDDGSPGCAKCGKRATSSYDACDRDYPSSATGIWFRAYT